MIEFRTEGQRQAFVRHLKDTDAITTEEYLLLMSLARGAHQASTHFRVYVERMCAERPELAIAAKVKQRLLMR
jgi:hypothetical protein